MKLEPPLTCVGVETTNEVGAWLTEYVVDVVLDANEESPENVASTACTPTDIGTSTVAVPCEDTG
jgi:hypothetical protein